MYVGSILFKSGDYKGAKLQYWEAIKNMEKMGHGLNNSQKADVFELTVSVNNNLSLCFMKLKSYGESSSYANNSIRLIEALEARAGESSLVFDALLQKGVIKSVDHMNKLWKRKALYCAGKAEYLRKNCDEATQYLEMAIKLITGDPDFKKDEDEIKALLTATKKLKKEILQKEKNMYAKAMKKASDEDNNNATRNENRYEEKGKKARKKSTGKDGKKTQEDNKGKRIIDVTSSTTVVDDEDEDVDENEDMWTIGLAIGAVAALGIAFFVWQRAKRK